jgi:hypothetical protein
MPGHEFSSSVDDGSPARKHLNVADNIYYCYRPKIREKPEGPLCWNERAHRSLQRSQQDRNNRYIFAIRNEETLAGIQIDSRKEAHPKREPDSCLVSAE